MTVIYENKELVGNISYISIFGYQKKNIFEYSRGIGNLLETKPAQI